MTSDEKLASQLCSCLAAAGYPTCVTIPAGGATAKIRAMLNDEHRAPSLVLVDLNVAQAVVLCRRLAALAVPVIGIAAELSERTSATAQESVPCPCLLAPFREHDLRLAIAQARALTARQIDVAGALRESERKYQEVIDSLTEAVFEADRNGVITFLNRTGKELFGIDEDDLKRGTSIFQLTGEDDLPTARRMLARGQQGESGARVELMARRRDGTLFPAMVDPVPVLRDGEVVGFRGTLVDLTDAKCAERERSRMEGQLRQSQKMEAIGTLAGGIAHDFNNILAAIIGYAELAQLDIPDGIPARRSIQQVITASIRAKKLVEQILSFSRPSELQQRPLDLTPVVKETLKLLRATLPSTISFRQRIGSSLPAVRADPTQINQLLLNLGSNAASAMRDQEGVLEVSLELVIPGAVERARCPELAPRPYVCLTVNDNGHGMDEQTLQRIFEPFFTTKGPGEGSGMGLAVVHGIVSSHSGAISVTSRPGEGSTFAVYLPVIAPTAEDEAQPEPSPVPTGRERVLFVDDEPALADLGRLMLHRLGYEVTSCLSGTQALQLFRTDPGSFDLVITDMTMPGLTGADLARQLLEMRPELPVVLCTGYSARITEDQALAIGIRRLLTKPLTSRDVAAVVREVLDEPVPD